MKCKISSVNISISLLILSLFLLWGCTDTHSGESATTAVQFDIQWEEVPVSYPLDYEARAVICDNISHVSASVFTDDSEDRLIQTGGPWRCEDGSGTIDTIPSGSNAKVRVYATDENGYTLYIGDSASLYLSAGDTLNAGTIYADQFDPPNFLNDILISENIIELSFNAIANNYQSGYRIELSKSTDFTDVFSFYTDVTHSETESYRLDTTYIESGIYHCRIFSEDKTSHLSRPSNVRQLSIKTAATSSVQFGWTSFEGCTSAYLTTAYLYDETNTAIHSQNLDCTPTTITVEDIPVGVQIRAVIRSGTSVNEGDFGIRYRDETPPLTVVSDGSNFLGEIRVELFRPGLVLPNASTSVPENAETEYQWLEVTGAHDYRIVLYNRDVIEAYSQIVGINRVRIDVSIHIQDPFFYWRVFAVDALDNKLSSHPDITELRANDIGPDPVFF